MDLRQIEYILEIAKENNITHAAEKLFISQSALNQQLLKLEKEFGTQLFYRSRTNWRPTPAGEVYIEGARKILQIKRDTYAHIDDIVHSQSSSFTIGLSPTRGIKMFTEIYPKFHQLYPNYQLRPIEMGVMEQLHALSRFEIDLAFVTIDNDQRDDNNYITVGTEEMICAIPSILKVSAKPSKKGKPLSVIDLREIREEPFILMYKNSTNRKLVDKIFAHEGFEPHVLLETSSTASMTAMVSANLACAIIPEYYVNPNTENISYYKLHGKPSWDMCFVYNKDGYLSDGMKAFIDLSKDYWDNSPHVQLPM